MLTPISTASSVAYVPYEVSGYKFAIYDTPIKEKGDVTIDLKEHCVVILDPLECDNLKITAAAFISLNTLTTRGPLTMNVSHRLVLCHNDTVGKGDLIAKSDDNISQVRLGDLNREWLCHLFREGWIAAGLTETYLKTLGCQASISDTDKAVNFFGMPRLTDLTPQRPLEREDTKNEHP